MSHVTSSLLVGLAAVGAWMMVAPRVQTASEISTVSAGYVPSPSLVSKSPVHRAAKGDRLRPVERMAHAEGADNENSVATVEVIGVRHTAIVYRDRNGNVLFRTDPLSNVTVVAKGFILPEVTIRERRDSATRLIPIEPVRQPHMRPALPIGCDPAVSPIVAPQFSGLAGRCLTQREGAFEVAAAHE